MRAWSKPLGVMAICAAILLSYAVGAGLVRTARYANAADEVDNARQQLATVQDLANVYKMVGKVVEPSVVKIDVHRTRAAPQRQDDLLRRFFPDRDGDGEPDVPEGFQLPDRDQQMFGTGSGVIMQVDGKVGYIITNNHVAGTANEMTVTLYDGRELKDGKVVGADPKTDLAVIRVEADGLIPARWGNSDYLEKGDLICAFGSPFGYVGSMTHGIVSALNRDRVGIIGSPYAYENFIQVDAAINPGNSGGPLVNLRGEVVGINTAIASRTGAFSGIGFAIPSNQARFVYDHIREKGRVVRGWLGVEINNVATAQDEARQLGYEGTTGVFIKGVQRRAPAQGQLEPGDVIVGLNGKPITNMSELRNQIAVTPPGTELTLDVFRRGEKVQASVQLGEQPDDLGGLAQVPSERRRDQTTNLEQLGLRLVPPTPRLLADAGIAESREGALVTSVEPQSPAGLALIQVGDLITKIGETAVRSPAEAAAALANADLAKGVMVHVVNRDGARLLFLRSTGR